MKTKDSDRLYEEYQSAKPNYRRFCTEVVKQLNEMISSASVVPALPIQYRVKTWNSILKKLEKKERLPDKLSDLPDIAGIRIVLLFQRDIDRVTKVIETTFKVLEKEDTRDRLGANEFGYGSIHYEVTTPDEWLQVPTLKPLEGIHGEIQVRTAAQHIWAAASQVLQYKEESDVPLQLRRAITRSAALLEIVDLEFERVLTKREEYSSDINLEDPSTALNTDTLKMSLINFLPKDNLDDPSGELYSELLNELKHFKITNVGALRALIKETWENVMEVEHQYVSEGKQELEETGEIEGTSKDRIMKGVYFNHTGLTREALRKKYGDDKLEKYWERMAKKKK